MSTSEFVHSLAIIIGINNYQNGIAALQTATHDAKRLAFILQTEHGYDVEVRLDQDATLEQIRRLLHDDLKQRVGRGDRLLFYFAGHGIADDRDDGPEGCLVPQDTRPGDEHSLLRMQELHDALVALPCRHLLVILDCCFAGAFRWATTRDVATVPEVLHQERYDRFIQDPAWQVITSAAHDQKAYDLLALRDERGQNGNHSPFALALFKAIQGEADILPPAKEGNPSGDGVITATELYLYLRDAVEGATIARRNRQTPGLWTLKKHDKGEYIFLVPGKNPRLPSAPLLREQNNPYRGLESYEKDHDTLFFGREKLIRKLKARIGDRTHRLTVVLGESGTGKSSLVNAGLVPQLERSTTQNWHVLGPVRPGESPFVALAKATLPIVQEASKFSNLELLVKELEQHPSTWVDIITHWYQNHPDTRLLVVIDQCEELITLCRERDCKQFLELLDVTLRSSSNQLQVVLTLRSDFEPQFSDSTLNSHWYRDVRFIVSPMTQDELRQVIVQPASERVLYFEPSSLVEQLINEVIQTPNPLPLLSFTLSELYLSYLKRQATDRALTQVDYDHLGGVAKALTQRAEQEYHQLVEKDSAFEQTIRRVMLRMIAWTDDKLTRKRVFRLELEYTDSQESERVETVLKQFTQARLLVAGQDIKYAYIEPAHDVLVSGWSRLHIWAQADRKQFALQQQIRQITLSWQQNSGSRMSGHLLQQAENFCRQYPDELNRLEKACIQDSCKTRRQNRLIAIAASITGLLFIGGFSWRLQQDAWTDRQLQNAMFNLPTPDVAQTLLQRIPDRLKQADRNRQNGQGEKALENYRTILAAMRRLEQGIAADPKTFAVLSKEQQQQVPAIAMVAETSLAETIRQQSLPRLEAELKKGNFGKLVDPQFSKFENQYTGALSITYAILLREAGAKADLNDDASLSEGEEMLLPCLTLKDIEKLWRQNTNNHCGFYGSTNPYKAPDCNELNGFTLLVQLSFRPTMYLLEQRLQQCQIFPDRNDQK
jgi:hypothetical protein